MRRQQAANIEWGSWVIISTFESNIWPPTLNDIAVSGGKKSNSGVSISLMNENNIQTY
jgi:hypothetical protein